MAAAAPADEAEGQVIRRVSADPPEANNAALVPAIGPSRAQTTHEQAGRR